MQSYRPDWFWALLLWLFAAAAITQADDPKDPSDPIAGREHWAFRPLARTLPPVTRRTDWARSSIDAFVLAKLEAANLQPAPDGDRRTLMRRVYLQLIGLPPQSEEIAAFLADPRPDAYERLVDQLLASPQFGERWGRHWLDLARYADSNGLDENFLFREAWRYRNWVIDATNADVPFDRFILEQVAGDLLPHDSLDQRDRQRIAAGFLVVGPKVLLGNDEKNQRMEIADEQLDTIGRAILGQTLGCARCHDHKFDPIPTADYYALAGILTSTQVMERRHMLNEQRVMERLTGLGADGDELDQSYEKYWRERSKLQARQKHAKSALELLEKDDANALESLIKKHADALADGAADATQPKEKRIEAQKELLASLNKSMAKPPTIPARAMIPCDRDDPGDESIRLSGQFDRLGDKVPRGFLRVFGDAAPVIPSGQSGRLELGRWLVNTDSGAGQLAARVFVNRVWHHVMGRGLVRTVDNFGRTGELPTHPELLDFLARETVESNWSLKDLVRSMVLSRTFMTSSRHEDAAHAMDPENRLLWRAHRRRLDPESLRDAMLLAAGELNTRPMESTVWYLEDQATAVGDNKIRRRTDFPCRSVYLPVIRNDLPELFDVFNFANPHATTGMRPDTLVATQGLFLLNDRSVMSAAETTARRVLETNRNGSDESRVETMFEIVLGTPPNNEDREAFKAFIGEMTKKLIAEEQNSEMRAWAMLFGLFDPAHPLSHGEKNAELRAWSMACHALFASSRFQIQE